MDDRPIRLGVPPGAGVRAAILQPNYIPWKGYFDLIHDVDLCLMYSCVQYTRQDWRNRNQIQAAGCRRWLTVPVLHPGLGTPIREVLIDNRQPWQARHFRTLRQHYGHAPCFDQVAALIAPYVGEAPSTQHYERLNNFNQDLLGALCGFLGIRTELRDSSALALQGRGTERVLNALRAVGARDYLSGPRAKDYLEEARFRDAGIALAYKSYEGYPPYPGQAVAGEHRLSILDLLFHVGQRAPEYIWGWRMR